MIDGLLTFFQVPSGCFLKLSEFGLCQIKKGLIVALERLRRKRLESVGESCLSFIQQSDFFLNRFTFLRQGCFQLRSTHLQFGDLILQTIDSFVPVCELIFKLRNSSGFFLSCGQRGRFAAKLGIELRNFLSLTLGFSSKCCYFLVSVGYALI